MPIAKLHIDILNLVSNAQTKYHDISTTNTETHHNTNRKVANGYIKFKYPLSTLQKYPDYFEQGCMTECTRVKLIVANFEIYRNQSIDQM